MHWAIFSPSLLTYPFSTSYVRDENHRKAILQLLYELDQTSDLVDRHFAEIGNMPMGKYFEQLLFFILNQDERYEVILKNHQVVEKKQTVGEIDLILRDTLTGQFEHWEIALKFYLQSKPSVEHGAMLGPNAIDNLAKKMKKLTERQLPLTTELNEIGILGNPTISNKLLLKGQFFYHISHQAACNIFPSHINQKHEFGWWCHLSEAERAIDKHMQWTTIRKPNWIGPILELDNNNLLSNSDLHDLLQQYFQQEIHSVLCVGLQQENGIWIEQTRGFVVNDDWPYGSKK